jgi:hypothetical protein
LFGARAIVIVQCGGHDRRICLQAFLEVVHETPNGRAAQVALVFTTVSSFGSWIRLNGQACPWRGLKVQRAAATVSAHSVSREGALKKPLNWCEPLVPFRPGGYSSVTGSSLRRRDMSKQNAPTTIEKFVSTHLAQIAVQAYSPPGMPQAARRQASAPAPAARLSRNKSFVWVGRGALVFVSGMAVGYLLSAQSEVSSVQAKASQPAFGAARLRIDYDLRDR